MADSTSSSSSKVQVVMREDSWAHEAGQKISVDKETADELVANGHAVLP